MLGGLRSVFLRRRRRRRRRRGDFRTGATDVLISSWWGAGSTAGSTAGAGAILLVLAMSNRFIIQFIFAFDFSANWLLVDFSFLVFDRSEDGRLLLVLDHEGALRGVSILLPLDFIVIFLAVFLVAFSLARSESCRVLNDEGARLGFLLAFLLVARAASCSA